MKPRRFLSNSFNKNYFPVATLSLAIFLVLIYAWMQPQDNTNRNNAVSFYFNQGLDKIEFPLYIKFLRKYMENEIYYRSINDIENEKISKIELYWMLSADPFFQSCLNNNACLEPNSLMHLKWQDKRIEYQKILNAISFQRFGFKPADPTCLTAFTSLFFQETSFQLWLNIIFILIIGVFIEARIGKLIFLLGYMISGMMMLSSSCWIVPYSIIPISGSSGGVAGLMGIMLALFCIQRWDDRLHVNENDLISLPMLCILPCWILLQLILVQLTEFDLVDFICQSAGFFFGILLMFYLYGMHCLNSCGKKRLVKHLNLETGLAEAYNEISLFNHTKAKKILYGLLEEYPTSKEIYFQLFNIVKLNP
ncbi:MAG: hypothetical protein BGO43_09055 [Gammaproteobacteria bacterium 39-13]|nr:rhomboid family intramembrane serine protease [Gammaproteobacteria bacterium]OJV94387.1 MAG: hypothetical protein BGO43_09055 [Gammaproteobacteria bacterium 39-13]